MMNLLFLPILYPSSVAFCGNALSCRLKSKRQAWWFSPRDWHGSPGRSALEVSVAAKLCRDHGADLGACPGGLTGCG